jgi:hypothetical protein
VPDKALKSGTDLSVNNSKLLQLLMKSSFTAFIITLILVSSGPEERKGKQSCSLAVMLLTIGSTEKITADTDASGNN